MKSPQVILAVGLMAAWLIADVSQAQEWTRFRGENGAGQGKAVGLPSKVTIADFNWIVDLPGSGHSSPVLWGNDLFLTVTAKGNKERSLLCYDAGSGKLKWKWSEAFKEHHQHRFNNFASSTPAVDAERVYLFWGSGDHIHTVAVDHAGKEVWSVKFEGSSSDHGTASSPILVDGLLIVQCEHKLQQRSAVVALNCVSGEEVWRYDRENEMGSDKEKTAYSTSVVYQGKDGVKQVLVVNSTHGFSSLNAKTGELLWQYNPGFKQRSVGSIALSGDVMFATLGSGGGGKESVALRLGGAGGQAQKLYSLERKGLPYVPTPLVYNGLFFLWGDGGILTCVEAETGNKLYQQRVASGTFFSSPIVTDGKIYCGSREGKMVVVAASREFKLLGISQLKSGIHATPAVANGKMFIRTDKRLICLGGRK
ncbi:MAG: PQQ-binding-like beta-propeller repeat protein [Verrucomicrobiales bacterium]|nr:PQQ-binding-like beta-propeller repeat protein [Verrucomicrobiales bacterium]